MYDCRLRVSQKKIGRTASGLFLSILLLISAGCASISEKKDATPADAASQKKITGLRTLVSGGGERVIVSANKQLQYTSVKQNNPLGILLLFPETTFQGNPSPSVTGETRVISSITASPSTDQKNTRLEIGLNHDVPYEVLRNGQDLEIVFPDQTAAAVAEAPAADVIPVSVMQEMETSGSAMSGTAPATATEDSFSLAKQELTEQPSRASAADTTPTIIDRIDFSTLENGKSSIIVGVAEGVIDYDIQTLNPRTLRVRVFNARLPEYRRNRPLITTRFESAVDRISPVPAADMNNGTDLVVELRERVPYRPVAENNLLTLHFDASGIGPRPFASAGLAPWQEFMETATANAPGAEVSLATAGEEENPYADLLNENKEYTGQKIALDFYKTDIKNVFKILQQVSGKNYAVDKNVTGEVTISLEKPVPWDQVLDLILDMNQLGKVEQGDIIRIATTATLSAEEAAKQKKIQAIRQRMEEQKTLDPLVTEYIPISYANAGSEILPHLKDILTKDRGTITVDGRNNQLIVTDTRPKIEKAREIINKIDKVTPQVLIEARIVEINNDFNRDVGVAWNASGDDIYKSGLDGQYSYNVAMNTPMLTAQSAAGQGTIGLNFTRLDAWGTPIVLDAALKAMESENKGKIISTPKILTLDNKKATIKQGQRFPFQTVEDDEVDIQFEDVDLSLEVTPHVTPDRRVSLLIKTTKNEIIGFIETGDPIISTNEAETELLVDDGETIVIGGVVKNDTKYTESGFPILKEIPMIGWLFKAKSQSNVKQELLIFMTPRIVQLEQKHLVQAEN